MLKEIAGRAELSLEVDAGARMGDVFERFAGASPRLAELRPSILMARNHEFARAADPVADGDEIAFLPPVSGGTGDHIFAITRSPIDTRALAARVRRDEDGAVVTFEGVVRNNTRGRATRYLEYECYEAMALKVMEEMGREIARRHEVGRIAIVHRLGRMEIGETSVAIVVGAPHRRPAFEAAMEAIDRLKKVVPIWKKEFFADGEAWVEGEWDDSLRAGR